MQIPRNSFNTSGTVPILHSFRSKMGTVPLAFEVLKLFLVRSSAAAVELLSDGAAS